MQPAPHPHDPTVSSEAAGLCDCPARPHRRAAFADSTASACLLLPSSLLWALFQLFNKSLLATGPLHVLSESSFCSLLS